MPILKIYCLRNRFSTASEFWNMINIYHKRNTHIYIKFIILDFDEFIKSIVVGWLNCIEHSTKIRIYFRDGSVERVALRQHDSG